MLARGNHSEKVLYRWVPSIRDDRLAAGAQSAQSDRRPARNEVFLLLLRDAPSLATAASVENEI